MQERQIPIRNLYYLLCYAWDQLEQGRVVNVTRHSTSELVDLFALILTDGVRHLSRRGIERGYEVHRDELSSLRGRIDVFGSIRRNLTLRGRAICEFDELTVNTLNNQILKGTLRQLFTAPNLDPVLKKEVLNCHRGLTGVANVSITGSMFNRIQLHSNTSFYRFLLNVCELVCSSSFVDSANGSIKFRDFVRDERAMARLFERFLFNFIRKEIDGATVKRDRIIWQAESLSDPALFLLPMMNTDISVQRRGRRLIIDAKYYVNPFNSRWESEKLHSSNLYQLMSYLANASFAGDEKLSGMLIYPKTDREIREKYVIQGHPVYIGTLNLDQDWQAIHRELQELVCWAL